MYKVPILFIFFNRVDITLKAFESIRKCKPKKLYLSSDGPRNNKGGDEKAIVEDLRDKVLSLIDWDCEVHTQFQSENVGCGPNMYNSINWLFENEERGIVLEDDCVASDSFFPFVDYMLDKYDGDTRIGMIAGTNVINNYKSEYSYLFSRFNICWGWATWRKVWKNMDYEMTWRHSSMEKSIINNRGYACKDTHRWRWQINYIENKYVSAWDWQWYFSLAAQNQLCVYPQVNLIKNIGADVNATHNSKAKDISHEVSELSFPLSDPPYIVPDIQFERLMYKEGSNLKLRINRRIPRKVKDFKNKILKIFK